MRNVATDRGVRGLLGVGGGGRKGTGMGSAFDTLKRLSERRCGEDEWDKNQRAGQHSRLGAHFY